MNNFYDPQPTFSGTQVGASIVPIPKMITQVVDQAFPELQPNDLMTGAVQGPTPEQIALEAFGGCAVPTGELFNVAIPYLSSLQTDSYQLPINSSPQSADYLGVLSTGTGGSRLITHRLGKQRKNMHTTNVQGGKAITIKDYGTYSFVDSMGVIHQPPGAPDPNVILPQVNVNVDGKTILVDANNQLYADIFGTSGSEGAQGTSVNGLYDGHGIEILPGTPPTDSPIVTMQTGGTLPVGSYQWAYCYVIAGQRTGLSPSASGSAVAVTAATSTTPAVTTAYQIASLIIPAVPSGTAATAIELYRKDTSIGADGTIHTGFIYKTTPTNGVLISDPSTGATLITSGVYQGDWVYTIKNTNGAISQGDTFEYSPLAYVVAGDPPIPLDPRTNAECVLDSTSSYGQQQEAFVTADKGTLNPITGDITFPLGSPQNHSGYQLVTSLPASASGQTYVDQAADSTLTVAYVRTKTTVNIKPARYILAPFSSMPPLPGTNPPLYELSGLGFNSSDPTVGNDGVYIRTNYGTILDKQNYLDVLLAASGTLPATGTGNQTATAVPGYDTNVYNKSGLIVTGGDTGTGLQVNIDGTTITQTASGQLMSVGGGTGAAIACMLQNSSAGQAVIGGGAASMLVVSWSSVVLDEGGWVNAGTSGTNIIFPASGVYHIDVLINVFFSGSGSVDERYEPAIFMYLNGYTLGSPTGQAPILTNPQINGARRTFAATTPWTFRAAKGDTLTINWDGAFQDSSTVGAWLSLQRIGT